MGLVCSCLTSWPRALCSGDCVHVIRLPWPASASRGLVWTCSSSPRPSSMMWGLCTLVSSHCSHSLSWGLFVLLLAVPGGTCALPKFICLPLSAPQSHPLRRLFVGRHTRLPGPALCAARVVCAGWVCTPCHSRFPEPPPVWGHSPWAVNGLRSAALPVYCPPSPCCASFFKTVQRPLGSACEGVSLCSGTPVSGLSPSLGAQVPAQKFSIFSLFMSPSFLLPHFRELKLFPWRPGVCCCHLEFAL